jgi:hypothetical protein
VSSSGTPPRASQSNQDSIVNEPQLLTITSNEKKSVSATAGFAVFQAPFLCQSNDLSCSGGATKSYRL